MFFLVRYGYYHLGAVDEDLRVSFKHSKISLTTGVELTEAKEVVVPDDAVTILPGPHFRTAMVLAIVADVLQIAVFPLFVEGALSPADDVLDVGISALLVRLLGWHWEFLPSFLAKLAPGVDLIPFWTLAVANVYRKSKLVAVKAEEVNRRPVLKDLQQS